MATEINIFHTIPWFSGSGIREIFISPDGKRFYTMGSGSTMMWDLNTLQCIQELPGGGDMVLSKDGTTLYTLSLKEGIIEVDLRNGNIISEFESWSPAGYVKKYDTNLKCMLEYTEIEYYPFESLALSPDGKSLVCGSNSNISKKWDLTTGQYIMGFYGCKLGYETTELKGLFSSDSFSMGEVVQDCSPYMKEICITPDGRHLLTGGYSSQSRMWNYITGEEIKSFKNHTQSIFQVSVSNDSRFFFATGHVIQMHEIGSGELHRTFKNETSSILKMALFPNGKKILTSNDDGSISIWNTSEEPLQRTYTVIDTSTKEINRENSDSPSIGILTDDCFLTGDPHRPLVRKWNLDSEIPLQEMSYHTTYSRSLVITPDNQAIIVACDDGTIRRIDMRTLEISILDDVYDERSNILISQDGDRMVFCFHDKDGKGISKQAKIKQIDTGDITCTFSLEKYLSSMNILAFSKDEKFIITAGFTDYRPEYRNKMFVKWNSTTGKEIFSIRSERIMALTVTSKSIIAIVGSFCLEIKQWDIVTSQEIMVFMEPGESFYELIVSNDEQFLISSGNGFRKWNLRTGKCIAHFGLECQSSEISLTHDDDILISGGEDGMIHVWDLDTGKCLEKRRGHSSSITAISLDRVDSKCFVTSGYDGTVAFWKLHKIEMIARCHVIQNGIFWSSHDDDILSSQQFWTDRSEFITVMSGTSDDFLQAKVLPVGDPNREEYLRKNNRKDQILDRLTKWSVL